MVANIETDIWERLVNPSWAALGPEAAEAILRLKFGEADVDRMNELAALAREDCLTEEQKVELDSYIRIGRMVAVLQAKARLAARTSGR